MSVKQEFLSQRDQLIRDGRHRLAELELGFDDEGFKGGAGGG